MPKSKHLIVLTCTVRTQMTTHMKRSDPEVRLNDYVESIRKWSRRALENDWQIVIAENSNSIELIKNSLSQLDYRNLQFIPLSLDQKSHLQGNSAGEFRILQELVELQAINDPYDYLWKVTGRLFIPNFHKIANNATGEVVVNRLYAAKHQIDARIIGFTPKMFTLMFDQNVVFSPVFPKEGASSYQSMEHYLTQKTLDIEIGGVAVKTMNQVPIFVGVSGTSNKTIDNFTSRCKKYVSNMLRPVIIKLLAGSSP